MVWGAGKVGRRHTPVLQPKRLRMCLGGRMCRSSRRRGQTRGRGRRTEGGCWSVMRVRGNSTASICGYTVACRAGLWRDGTARMDLGTTGNSW